MHLFNKLPVTIVTANYNNGRYLENFFTSIMESSSLPECIIVVDDGSTDESNIILDKFCNEIPNLTVIKFSENRGFANALNAGMEKVTTEFVLRLDPDDWIVSSRIETQVKFLQNNQDISVVGSNVYYVNDSNGAIVGKSNFRPGHEWIIKKYESAEYGIMHGAICARTALFKKYLYRQDYVPAEDYAIFAQMISDGVRFANIKEILTCVRIHSESISNSLKIETVEKIFFLRKLFFKINYSKMDVKCAFKSRQNYRIALSCNELYKRIYYLTVAGIFNPRAVMRRLGIGV